MFIDIFLKNMKPPPPPTREEFLPKKFRPIKFSSAKLLPSPENCHPQNSHLKYFSTISLIVFFNSLNISIIILREGNSMRTNNIYRGFEEIISGVPQGSIVGPNSFNVFLNDFFYHRGNASVHHFHSSASFHSKI